MVNKLLNIKTIKAFEEALNVPIGTLQNLKQKTLYNKRFKRKKDGFWREINTPSNELKLILRNIHDNLITIEKPKYLHSAYPKVNSFTNAKAHKNFRNHICLDIFNFYKNSQAKYVKDFALNSLKMSEEVANYFVMLTTFEGHLATGAPSSPVLSALIHKPVFDNIAKKMEANNLFFTLYFDDISISSNGRICNWVEKYVKNSLKRHCLYLKKSKTKRFGFKGAHICKLHITQSKKLEMPFAIGHSIVNILERKNVNLMNLKEVRSLISRIGYCRNLNNKFKTTKSLAIKRLIFLNQQSKFQKLATKLVRCIN